MKKNGDNKGTSRKPVKKDSLGTKVLRFFGIGKKDGPRKPSDNRQRNRQSSNRKPRRKPEITEPTTGRLYVGNLSYQVKDEELADFFGKAGTVVSADIITNPHNGKSKGFGFVEMGSLEEAKKAVQSLQNQDFKGRQLLVSGAKSKPTSRESGSSSQRQSESDRPPRRDSSSRSAGRGRSDGSRNSRGGGGERRGGRKRYEDDPQTELKPRKVETVTGNVLQASNLAEDVTEDDLREVFRDICTVTSVQVASDDSESDKKGSAQVEFPSVEEAQKAVNILHGKSFMGQQLSLSGASS